MRYPTCTATGYPGFIVWREVEDRDGLCRQTLYPCPACGGSAMTRCRYGAVGRYDDIVNGVKKTE